MNWFTLDRLQSFEEHCLSGSDNPMNLLNYYKILYSYFTEKLLSWSPNKFDMYIMLQFIKAVKHFYSPENVLNSRNLLRIISLLLYEEKKSVVGRQCVWLQFFKYKENDQSMCLLCYKMCELIKKNNKFLNLEYI